jgi:CheY-like chemotaxis protein
MKTTRTAPFAKLVVVIEDNPLVLEATTGLLRSWGCCVVAAKCCDEALVSLSETEADRRPDAILCDYQLSRGLTGVDAPSKGSAPRSEKFQRFSSVPMRAPLSANSSPAHTTFCTSR